ncbi:TPA: hypothetical protein P7N21_004368 [Citrobacter freundii]|nr:hypothetical protein [Citrobacter freundii]
MKKSLFALAMLVALSGCTHTTYTEATRADGSTVKPIDFDDDEDTPGVDIDYMTFCRKRIPLSDIEASALMSRLESFVEKNGSLFGFVTQLLTEGADA